MPLDRDLRRDFGLTLMTPKYERRRWNPAPSERVAAAVMPAWSSRSSKDRSDRTTRPLASHLAAARNEGGGPPCPKTDERKELAV